ncbi:MAG: hypothetical protein DDT20_01776 [Firmicutes bacterium]|nr:hypothetical protein [Bacillota bacterium]
MAKFLKTFRDAEQIWLGLENPGSEEIDFILKGRALAIDAQGNETVLEATDCMFIPEGEYHQHVSIGAEPLWLLWVYTPQAELPPAKA